MDKIDIRMKCDRILLDKQPQLSSLVNQKIQKVYKKHEETLGKKIDYRLLTDFTSSLLTAYSAVISQIMVDLLEEVLSEDEALD